MKTWPGARFAHDHTLACKVCEGPPTTGLRTTGAAIPPPFKNPKRHDGTWFHGTSFDPRESHDYEGDGHKDRDNPGGTLQAPDRYSSEYGTHANHHWNTDLGVHFTSLDHVARGFATGGPSDGGYEKDARHGSRVLHAGLHMGNPKHYEDEQEMAHHAIDWAHNNGHHFIEPGHSHKAFVDGHLDHMECKHSNTMDERDECEGAGFPQSKYSYLHNEGHVSSTGARQAISDISREGSEGHHLDHTETYLRLHPHREEITEGFRQHLQSKGHDGIIYGNSHEGPANHPCAIAFPDTPIHHKRWQWLHEDEEHLNDKQFTEQGQKSEQSRGQQELPGLAHHEFHGSLVPVVDFFKQARTEPWWDTHIHGPKAPWMKRTKDEHSAHLEAHKADAERATNGNMVSPEGKANGIRAEHFFQPGSRRTVEKWGTPEMKTWVGSDSAPKVGDTSILGKMDSLTEYRRQVQKGERDAHEQHGGSFDDSHIDYSKFASLSDEARVSVAESVMEDTGHSGKSWHVPRMHQDDPERKAAHKPVHDYVNGVLQGEGHDGGIRVHPHHWDLREPGSGQAVTDGMNYIGLKGEDTHDLTLLHECAHILTGTGEGHGGHGPEFKEVVSRLYRKHLSPEAADTFDSLAHPPKQKTGAVLDTWAPSERLFAPTKGGVDPRLFDPETRVMKANVRAAVAVWVNEFFERHGYEIGGNWYRTYLAGSQASEWYGNNDFDILVGIEYSRFRKANPHMETLLDTEIGAKINGEFREDFNDEQWYPPFDRDNEWHLTGYVNKDSWDIAKIKPYAAYNITDNVWAVEPIHEPTGHHFNDTEMYYFEGVAAQVRSALNLHEPLRRIRCTQLWTFIHTDRSRAFGPHGAGAFDRGNALEKYLSQAPSGDGKNSLMAALAQAKFAQTTAGANGGLPEGITFHHGGPDELGDDWPYSCHDGEREVRAKIDGKSVGQVKWLTQVNPNANVTVGHISNAGVHPDYHRRGVATELLRRAREVDPTVHHSHNLTGDGKAWSEKVAHRGHDVYGSNNLDRLFPEGSPITSTPWPMAPRTKTKPIPYSKELLGKALMDPGKHMDEVDPRNLHAYQPSITRAGVNYYMGDHYKNTGETFADGHHAANQVPVIYTRHTGESIILAGHHRAAAALLKGEKLQCLHVREEAHDGAEDAVRHADPVPRRASAATVSHGSGEDGSGGAGGHRERWYRRLAARLLDGGRGGADDAGREPAAGGAADPVREDRLAVGPPADVLRRRASLSRTAQTEAHKPMGEKGTTYLRFGKWRDDERSVNHVEGWHEEGVSVYEMDHHGNPIDPDEHMKRDEHDHEYDSHLCNDDGPHGKCNREYNDQYTNDTGDEMRGRVGRAIRAHQDDSSHDRGHLVHGDVTGIGHDGEPLLRNVKRVGDWINHRHHFVPTAKPHRLAEPDEHDEDFEEHKPSLQAQAWYKSDHPDVEEGSDLAEYAPDTEGVKTELDRLRGGPRVKQSELREHMGNGTVPKHLYRAISESDFHRAKSQGYLDTHGEGNWMRPEKGEHAEGMVTSPDPHGTARTYLPDEGGRVVKIETHPEHGWRPHRHDRRPQWQTATHDTKVPWEHVVDHSAPIKRTMNPDTWSTESVRLEHEPQPPVDHTTPDNYDYFKRVNHPSFHHLHPSHPDHKTALQATAGMFGPEWYETAHDDEIDAHPAADSIRSRMATHTSPQGHVYRLYHDSSKYVHATYLGKGENRIKKPQIVGSLTYFGGKAEQGSNIPGRIHKVFVKPAHQRRGIASAMLDHARAMKSPNDDIEHSSALSEDGKAWSDKKASKGQSIEVAGVVIKAEDTGRVLMLQRSFEDESDPARGTWEFPGGHIDEGENPFQAARREWGEETGGTFPDDAPVVGNWISGGMYQGFIVMIPKEGDLDINLDHDDRQMLNPDDPDGDGIEVVAWWDLKHLKDNPAVRKEVTKGTDWDMLKKAKLPGSTVTKAAQQARVALLQRVAEMEDEYRMSHRPPSGEDDTGSPIHDLTHNLPADVYTHPHYYSDMSEPSNHEAHSVIRRVRNRPDAKVHIYRALPAEHAHTGIRPGDWVTTSKEYAKQHGKHATDPKHDMPVIRTTVPAKHLHTDGDDFREFGYTGTETKPGMVAYKGGYHQEISQRADGSISPVQRKPKTASKALPQHWQDHIDTFKAQHNEDADDGQLDYRDPEDATGQCLDAAGDFAHHVKQRSGGKHEAREEFFEHLKEVPPRKPQGVPDGKTVEHLVNITHDSGHVIDWTARQFHPDADFPHVEPVETYRKKWHHTDANPERCDGCKKAFDNDEDGDHLASRTATRGLGWHHIVQSQRSTMYPVHPVIEHYVQEKTGVHPRDMVWSAEPFKVSDATPDPHGIRSKSRLASAEQGYRTNPKRVPPVIAIEHEGKRIHVDGWHRLGGAQRAGLDQVPAYVGRVRYPQEHERAADGPSGQPGQGLGQPRGGDRGPSSAGIARGAGLASAGAGVPGGLTWHPKAAKDLKALDRPVQKQILDTLDGISSADPLTLSQTHPLTGPMKGWYSTKASRGHRIIHQPNSAGGVHVGYVGLHEYDRAIQRLTSLTIQPEHAHLWPKHPLYRPGDKVQETTGNGNTYPATVHHQDESSDHEHHGTVWIKQHREGRDDDYEIGVHPSRVEPHPDAPSEQHEHYRKQKALNDAGVPYVPEAERHIDESDRVTVHHLTDKPDFAPDHAKRPDNNTTMGGSLSPRLFVGNATRWAEGEHGYRRPYVAEMSAPKGVVQNKGGYLGEGEIPARHFDKVHVTRVLPYHEHRREQDEPGYRSPVDARTWSPKQHKDHLKAHREDLHTNHGWGWNEFDKNHNHVGLGDDDWSDKHEEYIRRDKKGKPMTQHRSSKTAGKNC